MPGRRTHVQSRLVAALFGAMLTSPVVWADAVDDIVSTATAAPAKNAERAKVSIVRETAIKQSAQALCFQTSFWQTANGLLREHEQRARQLTKDFNFGVLLMGAGFVPPVIVKTTNNMAIEGKVIRIAHSTYRIKAGPRAVAVAPNWRDYLDRGLVVSKPDPATGRMGFAQSEVEAALFKEECRRAADAGRAEANNQAEANRIDLLEDFDGMRTFYELYERRMVTAPAFASVQDIANRNDPNVLIIGDTVFRIVADPVFTAPDAWRPIGASKRTSW